MISNPNQVGFYSPSNITLVGMFRDDVAALAERWLDEAADAAVAGNPQKAHHIEAFIGRLA